jgi:hypothetical protein
MIEEQIEVLLDAIEGYNVDDPYIILLYIPCSDDDNFYDFDFIFAAMSSKKKPNNEEIEALIKHTKQDIGNMVYASEILIMQRDEAIDYLRSLI